MIRYNELLERKLKELKTDAVTFFRIAYCYKFGCDANVQPDVQLYKEKSIVPVYVRQYLDVCTTEESSCK